MKFSQCLSFIPILATLLTITVVALPIRGSGSAIEARNYELNGLETRSVLELVDALYERGVALKLSKIFGQKKLTPEQKWKEINRLNNKHNQQTQKHLAKLSKIEDGHTGLKITKYEGDPEHRKVAEKYANQNYTADLHKFGQANLRVEEHVVPGKLYITTEYHNGPGTIRPAKYHTIH